MTDELTVSATALAKTFGTFTAVVGATFQIRQGECFGLLGPNGAGKSTIISMIYGAASRSGGDLSVFARDPETDSRRIKERIGVVTQDNALDDDMNVLDNMRMFAKFVGVPSSERENRVRTLLDFMSLSHKAKAGIRTLSGGMQRRLVFVRALLADPDFVILDEPTTGLDPAVRQVLWEKINNLKKEGKTVLLTTHYMDEAERLCDRLVIMDQGQVKAEGSPRELIHHYCPGFLAVFEGRPEGLEVIAESDSRVAIQQTGTDTALQSVKLDDLMHVVESNELKPHVIRPANLEDVFLAITGRDLSSNA